MIGGEGVLPFIHVLDLMISPNHRFTTPCYRSQAGFTPHLTTMEGEVGDLEGNARPPTSVRLQCHELATIAEKRSPKGHVRANASDACLPETRLYWLGLWLIWGRGDELWKRRQHGIIRLA